MKKNIRLIVTSSLACLLVIVTFFVSFASIFKGEENNKNKETEKKDNQIIQQGNDEIIKKHNTKYYSVTSEETEMKEKPNSQSNTVHILSLNDVVEYIEQVKEGSKIWILARIGSYEGYIEKKDLTVVDDSIENLINTSVIDVYYGDDIIDDSDNYFAEDDYYVDDNSEYVSPNNQSNNYYTPEKPSTNSDLPKENDSFPDDSTQNPPYEENNDTQDSPVVNVDVGSGN
ncbi:MAG: hypothetical protein SOZ89_03995 [Peptoniphilaceae bacterium]|nr:hypothetical protein [Peptoniphilaceae bacterium]MDD7383361.1 hypothetical protein [Peptoniphilaceae bacterium]MDY3738268.1 hypothetical protein [Peptoniphilaceae bacterium]